MGDWIDWNTIMSLGAGKALAHFGSPQDELAAAASHAVIAPLTHFDLLRFHGGDAKAFLQAQLTCDVNQVTPEQARFGGYCAPNGRLLANFLLMQAPSGYLMQLPAEIAPGIADRLRKFILRAKVTVERAAGLSMVGLAGPEAPALLQEKIGDLPPSALGVRQHARATLARLPAGQFLLMASSEHMAALWQTLAQEAVPVGAECWNGLQIRAGIAWVGAATQEQFLPQMIGLDTIGGVSFDKGCYPGQEIVARSRYLGEIKRKLRFGHSAGEVRIADALHCAGQSCGSVLNAAASPRGGWDFLAVVGLQADADVPVQLSNGQAVELSAPHFSGD